MQLNPALLSDSSELILLMWALYSVIFLSGSLLGISFAHNIVESLYYNKDKRYKNFIRLGLSLMVGTVSMYTLRFYIVSGF